MNENSMTWKTITEYVDLQTGEILSKKEYTKNYITIKKEKYVYIKTYDTTGRKIGYITWRNLCTRQGKQLSIV